MNPSDSGSSSSGGAHSLAVQRVSSQIFQGGTMISLLRSVNIGRARSTTLVEPCYRWPFFTRTSLDDPTRASLAQTRDDAEGVRVGLRARFEDQASGDVEN